MINSNNNNHCTNLSGMQMWI
uniref:Uncharacterized protein n=1 Tax=Anguilla anguilla TaxID=7936 RepID=A0A0E9U1P6_ANGAN